jgi:hypothetical protein
MPSPRGKSPVDRKAKTVNNIFEKAHSKL